MLEKVKLALRITTTAFDSELTDLINAAKVDLGIAGVVVSATTDTNLDVIIQKAIITYCKLNFGEPDEYTDSRGVMTSRRHNFRWLRGTQHGQIRRN